QNTQCSGHLYVTSASSQSGLPALLGSDPAFSMYMLQETHDVPSQVRTGKCGLQVFDNAAHGQFAVDALHDFAGTAWQLHHALRIEQDESLLRRLPLKAEVALQLEHGIVGERKGFSHAWCRRCRS